MRKGTATDSGKAPECVATWYGHIETTRDALIIFEACFTGKLAHCFRRPHDRERGQLIRSGNVFVYEEATSGIKRWTDGVPWSPSRILTNFLIYRQLNHAFAPGEKKRATKRGQRHPKAGDRHSTTGARVARDANGYRYRPVSPEESSDRESNRGLLGSLVDSYEFEERGLLKKTMTVVINNVQHHVVSYYSLDDAINTLQNPRQDPLFDGIQLRDELLNQPKFKFANYDDPGDGAYDPVDAPSPQFAYGDPTQGLGLPRMASHGQQDYFPGVNPYMAPIQHPNNFLGYPSIPLTPSIYVPMPQTTNYPPTTSTYVSTPSIIAPYSPHHHQHQMQQQNNHPTTLPFSNYPTPPQYSQSQHRLTHQISFPEQNQHLAYPPGPNILPRPALSPTYEFNTAVSTAMTASQDSYNQSNDYYNVTQPSIAPSMDATVLLPTPWQSSSTAPNPKTEPRPQSQSQPQSSPQGYLPYRSVL